MIAFGPVLSRRFGNSLGINNIPSKHCSYSCMYCQVGCTSKLLIKRKTFYNPEDIFAEALELIKAVRKNDNYIDYLTFVASGEPTLDINLGESIDLLKFLDRKIAVISNCSLIWRKDVRHDLAKANLVSMKIDTIDENNWQKLNRPHKSIKLQAILDGLVEFSSSHSLITESMIIKDLNDDPKSIEQLALFISMINPEIAYISTPTRPPAENHIRTPNETAIIKAYEIFKQYLTKVELLVHNTEDLIHPVQNIENDILNIASVHPIKGDSLKEYLFKNNSGWHIIEKLIEKKELVELFYEGHSFYIRSINQT